MGILGSRKADSVNYLFFDNKSIPPLIVTVSGGQLTSETVAILRDLFEKEVKGLDNFHRALILEATPASVATLEGDKASTVKIEVKPLTQFIESDAQFLEYQRHVAKGMRGCFRIPAAILAFSEDHTRATVVEATRVAEEQVFIPERRPFDYMINTKILADMRIQYFDFRSLGAKTSDNAAIVRSMAGVKDALPVGVIQEAVADLRNTPVGEIPAELYEMTLGEMLRMSAGSS
jgi:capsid portal protein